MDEDFFHLWGVCGIEDFSEEEDIDVISLNEVNNYYNEKFFNGTLYSISWLKESLISNRLK